VNSAGDPREFCQYGHLLDIHVDHNVVKKKLDKLCRDKPPEADDIQPGHLKEIAEEVCLPLTIIFWKSLEISEVPEDWRTATTSTTATTIICPPLDCVQDYPGELVPER